MVVAAVAFTPGVYGTHEFSLAQVYPLFIFLLFITCLFKYSLEEKLCDAFPASESQLDVVLGQYCVVCCCVKMSTNSYFGGNTSSVDAFSLAANRISGESEISTIKCTKSDSASTLWCQFARSFCHSACLLQLPQRKTPENWRVSISPKSRISYHSKFHTINEYLRFRLLGFFFELV